MDSPSHGSEFDDVSDLYTDHDVEFLKGLLFSVVNSIPMVDVECYHSKINQTDIRHLEQSVEEAKERNRTLNRQLFEYFHTADQV